MEVNLGSKKIEDYVRFQMEYLNPLFDKMLVTNSKKKRRSLQDEIIKVCKQQGYLSDAKKYKAFFNL